MARHHLVYDVGNAERFRNWAVMSIEKNRTGLDQIDLEFRKRFEQGRFEPEGSSARRGAAQSRSAPWRRSSARAGWAACLPTMRDNEPVTSPRTVAVLGSTGSIGTQALDVIARNPDRFRVVALSAGSNLDLVAEQAVAFDVDLVAVARGTHEQVAEAIGAYAAPGRPRRHTGPRWWSGTTLRSRPRGAAPTSSSTGSPARSGCARRWRPWPRARCWRWPTRSRSSWAARWSRPRPRPDQIVPVDSEHSAIAQCLRGGRAEEVRRLVVTASGGPFRGRSRESLRDVTPAEALAHPNFSMGRVITTNSATLVNKGLEVIEAHLLFDIPFDRIDVVVHPQQMIHSMVEFVDGSTIAQAGPPRMLVPIALGLSWPERLADVDVPVDWTRAQSWEFEPLDDEAFPAVRLARQVGEAGGT